MNFRTKSFLQSFFTILYFQLYVGNFEIQFVNNFIFRKGFITLSTFVISSYRC